MGPFPIFALFGYLQGWQVAPYGHLLGGSRLLLRGGVLDAHNTTSDATTFFRPWWPFLGMDPGMGRAQSLPTFAWALMSSSPAVVAPVVVHPVLFAASFTFSNVPVNFSKHSLTGTHVCLSLHKLNCLSTQCVWHVCISIHACVWVCIYNSCICASLCLYGCLSAWMFVSTTTYHWHCSASKQLFLSVVLLSYTFLSRFVVTYVFSMYFQYLHQALVWLQFGPNLQRN